MKRRDVSLTIGLCVSFAAHILLLRSMANRYADQKIYLTALPILRYGEGNSDRLMIQLPENRHLLLGDDRTKQPGEATDSATGEKELVGRQTDHTPQPLIQHDAPGNNGAGRPQLTPVPQPIPAEQPKPAATVADATPRAPSPAQPPTPELRGDEKLPGPAPAPPVPNPPASESARANPSPHPTVAAISPATATQEPKSSSAAPGKPIQQGESDSPALTTIGSVDFRGSAINARLGRRHRITRPRIDLAGLVDAVSLGRIYVTMQFRIDQQGNVIDVQIVRPSGSANIDEATKIAAYGWWFEPRRIKGGDDVEMPAASETFELTLRY